MTGPRPVPCPRAGCSGAVMVTGFCDTCHRRPPAAPTPTPPRSAAPRPPAAPPTAPATMPTPPTVPDPTAPDRAAPGRTATRPDPAGPDPAGPHPAGPGAAAGAGTEAGPGPEPYAPGGNAAALDRDGLVLLPHVPAPDPAAAAGTTARPPTGGRRCGFQNCAGTIGIGYDGEPAPDHGFCPECGRPYSFEPRLRPGDEVGGHYRVLGYLAAGGLGWVYLAEDTEVPDHLVVLKGLINTSDAVARRAAVEERRSLTTLHHRDIVRIITFVQHQAPGEDEPTGYIVMEYIAGRSLAWIRYAPEEELTAVFGRPFGIDHVVTYGCKILGALEYLHEQGLLYCDMKPDNVIHYGRDIKVIDLGAVRRVDDRTSGLVYTRDYAPPKRERDQRGFRIDTDLYTVGRTLQALATRTAPAPGLAARSFDALVRRATHPDPAARFTSAAEMSRQLWEVLREHQALTWHEPYPERSTRFTPTAVLFGAALGTVPALEHWTADRGAPTTRPHPAPHPTPGPASGPAPGGPSGVGPGRAPGAVPGGTGSAADDPPPPPPLPLAPPDPREAARGLPVPIPDPGDPAAVLLAGLAADSPARIAEQARRDPALATAETALWLCRAYARAGDPAEAGRWLRTARGLGAGEYDWRVSWHRGLLRLTEGRVREAEEEFAAVYAALPGEWAPKLALGHCAEYLTADEPGTGGHEDYYEAVWQRDRTQGSAAFGLVRARLRRGDRQGALAVLDRVPTTSRHHDAARVAAVRVLAGRLPDGGPTADTLREAVVRLDALGRAGERDGAWDRLVTEVRENALAFRPPGGWGPGFPAGELLGPRDDERALRDLLSRSLRNLADQAQDGDTRGDLLDRAYAALPEPRLRLVPTRWRRRRTPTTRTPTAT
ncbi:serine/threonine-protein kinase [Streptomyces sp. DH12]|uniref:serine/threonine-protein kinase n=1 Tax=Streptomyces sp. DH12 TaxID=2857010 RepID=UPI001E45D9C6|nr:serine/threonine-protein kinase [Streptomyces sp. DH12]